MGNTTLKKKLLILTISLAVILTACAVYLNDCYRTDTAAVLEFPSDVTATEIAKDTLAFVPENAATGLIFYPGGKVEYTAYEPLMKACADRGILCVLVKMPFNLAVLDINAADGIAEKFPEIENWYVGGHSLGGSMAATYASKNTDCVDGVVLLGAYSTSDLTTLNVLSIYGSEDGIMNREKYQKYLDNLPENFTEYVIQGGNHADFGMYGEQNGDGKSTLSPTEQIILTADKIAEFVK